MTTSDQAPAIHTERLLLRPWTPDDAVPLHEILNEEGVLRYFPVATPPPLDRVERFVARQIQHWVDHSFGWWAVERIDRPGLLGWSGLQYLPETDEVEIGFLLRRSDWGQGLAAEGARAGIRFAFETAGLERIVAVAHPDNVASQRVIEKAGLSFVEQTVYFGMEVRRYVVDAATWARQQARLVGPEAARVP